jgi:hypothetical protein
MIKYSKPLIAGIVLLCFGNLLGYTQELKYETLYKDLGSLTPINAFSLLYKYQQQDPHFSNTYIQLGNVCEQIFKNIDPLRDFEYLDYWTNNAVLYYGLFPVYLQSNDVRRYREFYANLPIGPPGKKIENEDALVYLNQRLTFCKNYKDSTGLIFETLKKSKDHYNNCVRIFNEINNRFDNYNEALLQTDQSYLKLLNSLKSEYADCISAFNNYKTLINSFPIGRYNQFYHIKPIETFRLDGLTNSDFLKDTFDLWNYEKWVNSYLDVFNKEIFTLRQEINTIQKNFVDNKRKITLSQTLEPEAKFSSFDDLFLFRLGKYDNNSLVRDLFRYLDARQNYLMLSKSTLNGPTDSSTAAMNRRVRYYYRLAMQVNQCKEKHTTFGNSISLEKIVRFNDFFNQHYQGESGLKNFHRQESEFISKSFNTDLMNLSDYFESELQYRKNLGLSAGKGFSVALYPQAEGSPELQKATYVTQNVSFIQGAPQYVSGFIKRTGSLTMAFVAKIDKDKKIEWLREIGAKGKDILPAGDKAPLVFGYENGCVAIVTGYIDGKNRNTIVRLDSKGKELFSTKTSIDLAPAFLRFDEINQESILGFGRNYTDNPNLFNSITICQADSSGTIKWQTPIELQGQIVEILKTENKFLAFLNFESFNLKGERIIAGNQPNSWSHLIIEFSPNSNIEKHKVLPSSKGMFVNRVFPISNTEINLIGFESSPGERGAQLNYTIVNPKGDVIFTNH